MRVKTGEKKYAGTDANVHAILYGTKDDTGNYEKHSDCTVSTISPSATEKHVCVSGIINLKASKNYRNKFELGLIDEFTIEAVDIGKLKRIRIGHDNAGTRFHIRYHSVIIQIY